MLSTYYHLSNLIDTSPPPAAGGRQYELYLQAFNATNQSNVAKRTFIVYKSTNGVVTMGRSESPVELYPNPATNWVDVAGLSGQLRIYDALGRTWNCPLQNGKLNVANLPLGIYYIDDGQHHARFVKE